MIFFCGCKSLKPVSEKEPELTKPRVSIPDAEPTTINFSEQSTWLLGYFNINQLIMEPHSSWFIKGYNSYVPDNVAITRLKEISKENLEIKIVLGTWCPDSRREVPRFMKILDIWQFPKDKVTFIGVDNAKLSPIGDYVNLEIERVPTFIFYKENYDVGRIIENPTTSLEQDMVNILSRNE